MWDFLDPVYRVFMFLLPYAICVAAYIWMGRKSLQSINKAFGYTALAVVIVGFGYTAYEFIKSIGGIMTEDNFHYKIIIVMVAVLALASIIIAFGEPEK